VATAALGPGPYHRVQDALVAVQVIGDLADLAADEAVGDRAAAIAVDLHDAPAVDRHGQPAQVGAIERARAVTLLHASTMSGSGTARPASGRYRSRSSKDYR